MARLSALIVASLVGLLARALQVTPNSPCASFCIDSDGLDTSDPNSSNTVNADITCNDNDFTSTTAGQKFQRCMSCLQSSTFSQGQESDQAWFLYNLRYTFDYCIFGYPNATDIASTPCSTSTACGGLESALTYDGLKASSLETYGYCSADGSAMSGPSVSKCQACVSASDGQGYMTNFMVALDAGCQQQPATGTAVGLNDTIFSSTLISAEDPSSSAAASSNKPALATSAIVGIVIAAAAVVLIIIGVVFVQRRKRRNRRRILEDSPRTGGPRRPRRPVSSLSFRCQTHLSPRSPPPFFTNGPEPNSAVTHGIEKRPYSDATSPDVAQQQSPLAQHPLWSTSTSSLKRGFGAERERNPGLPLYSITTTTGDTKVPIPTVPSEVYHYASTSPKSNSFSPIDDTTTPASTTSTRSTAALLPLKPYNPADYGFTVPAVPQMDSRSSPVYGNDDTKSSFSTYSGTTSVSNTSPVTTRNPWNQPQQQQQLGSGRKNHNRSPIWESTPPALPVRTSSRYHRPGISVLAAATAKRSVSNGGRGSNSGSPVETKEIKVQFPGPPSPRKF